MTDVADDAWAHTFPETHPPIECTCHPPGIAHTEQKVERRRAKDLGFDAIENRPTPLTVAVLIASICLILVPLAILVTR